MRESRRASGVVMDVVERVESDMYRVYASVLLDQLAVLDLCKLSGIWDPHTRCMQLQQASIRSSASTSGRLGTVTS